MQSIISLSNLTKSTTTLIKMTLRRTILLGRMILFKMTIVKTLNRMTIFEKSLYEEQIAHLHKNNGILWNDTY